MASGCGAGKPSHFCKILLNYAILVLSCVMSGPMEGDKCSEAVWIWLRSWRTRKARLLAAGSDIRQR